MEGNRRSVYILIPQANHGGVENVINMTAVYLQQSGWNVRVIQLVGTRDWCDQSIPVTILDSVGKIFSLDETVQMIKSCILTYGMPDMILATVWPVMCTIAKRAIADIINSELLKTKPAKVVSWLHHGAVEYVAANGWGGYSELHDADGHLAINQYLYEELRQNFPEYPVMRVRNPVALEKMQLQMVKEKKKWIKDTGEQLQLIYVGRIAPEKRLDVLIDTLDKVRDICELTIVGSTQGEYENRIKEQIREYQLEEQVHFYPWMENPWNLSDKMDLCVMASDLEGFPLVAIEALAYGLPIFSTPAEGMDELIMDGVNGYLYPFEDAMTLSKLLRAYAGGRIPAMSPEICRQSVDRYDSRYVLPDLESKLQRLLSSDERN